MLLRRSTPAFAKNWGLTMQPIRNAQSENRRPRSVEFPNKRRAAIGLNAEMKRVIWDARNENSPAASKASPAVSRMLSLLCFVAALAAWSPASFAQQVVSGPIPTQLSSSGSPNGVANGVSMINQGAGGTLLVGTVGGPEMDIFTLNNPVAPGSVAVATDATGISNSNVTFNSSSTVFGAIGTTGLFFLNRSEEPRV